MQVYLPERVREAGHGISVAVIVFFSSWMGITLTRGEGRVATIWLANGVLLTLLITKGNRSALRLALIGFAANVLADRFVGDTLLNSLALASINILEVGLGYWLLTRKGERVNLLEVRSLGRFTLYACMIAPLLCAAVASAVLSANHGHYVQDFRIWFLADALGMAVTGPVIFAFRRPSSLFELFAVRQLSGTIAVMALLTGSLLIVFWQPHLPLLFLIFPALVLVVHERGFSGAALAVCVIAVAGIWSAVFGYGPLMIGTGGSFVARTLLLQGYLAAVIATSFPLAAVLGERDRLHERLNGLVYIDALTDLPNRRHFDMRFGTEWRRAVRAGSPISVMMIDVDEFKSFNDYYGHQAGDRCLERLASAFQATVRRSADFVARYGGEEFVIVLPETSASGAEIVANNLVKEVELLKMPHSKSLHRQVTISIGTAFANPQAGGDPATLLRAADRALYKAKAAGRNCIQVELEPVVEDLATPGMHAPSAS